MGQLGIERVYRSHDRHLETPTRIKFPVPVTVKQIACGDSVSMELTRDGNLYTWGYGEMGATGHQGIFDVKVPTLLSLPGSPRPLYAAGGGQHSMLLTNVQKLVCLWVESKASGEDCKVAAKK